MRLETTTFTQIRIQPPFKAKDLPGLYSSPLTLSFTFYSLSPVVNLSPKILNGEFQK